MKQHVNYECEVCGCTSEEREEIMICEASHFGLTVEQKQRWDLLKFNLQQRIQLVEMCKEKCDDKRLIEAAYNLSKAAESLLYFESNYMI